jgi:hypothetical protein
VLRTIILIGMKSFMLPAGATHAGAQVMHGSAGSMMGCRILTKGGGSKLHFGDKNREIDLWWTHHHRRTSDV